MLFEKAIEALRSCECDGIGGIEVEGKAEWEMEGVENGETIHVTLFTWKGGSITLVGIQDVKVNFKD